jgi:alcohol dehydrogenase
MTPREAQEAPAVPAGAAWTSRVGGTRLVFGEGALRGLGDLAREKSGRRVLLVTDPGVSAAGHAGAARAALEAAGAEVLLFDGVEENPSTRHVEAGVSAARDAGIDLIVALGGGSAMDCAKGINFLLTNGGRMEDYWGYGRAARPLLPAIGVPTTAGTGSDAQSYALIEQEPSRRKMACGDDTARFGSVILDPELTASCPPRVTAVAGLDALSHTVESWVTLARNPVSELLSRGAWKLLSGAFERVLEGPSETQARGEMLLGAHLAGAAVEASMLGAAHAAANPLTARNPALTHGEAVMLMLPHVVRFNEPAWPLYAALDDQDLPPARAAEALARRLESLRDRAGLPGRLRDAGVSRDTLPALAGEAAEQWTGRFNPRPAERSDFEELYHAAW